MVSVKNREKQIYKLDAFKNSKFYQEVTQLYLNGQIKTITTAINYLKKLKINKDGFIDESTNIKILQNLLNAYQNKPLYDEILFLYDDYFITLNEAVSFLKKIKLTKKGNIDKRSSKKILQIIEDVIPEDEEEIIIEDGVIGSNEIKIDYEKIEEGYDFKTHRIEFQKIRKEFKKSLYIQEVKFYTDEGKEINKIIEITEDGLTAQFDFKNKKFISENPLNKTFIETVYFKMRSTLNYQWLPSALIEINKNYYTIITTKAYDKKKIDNVILDQDFQDDNEGVCVYNNFLQYFKSKEKNRNAKAIYNKLIKPENITKYRKSYKKHELKQICDFCNTSLYIRDLVNGRTKDVIINNDYARFKIEMVNTKYNHLDLLMSDNDITEVNEEEYNKIKKNSSFYVEKYGQLQNLEGVYKIKLSKFQELKNEWKKEYNIQEKYIYDDTFEYKLIDTYDYKLHSFFNPFEIDDDLYNEVDLKKAYYNYSNIELNKNYVGMPNGNYINAKCNKNFNIDMYENLCNAGFIGFFQVKIKKITSKKEHLNKLNFFEDGKYTLTNPLINLLKNHVEFKFYSCSYSTKSDMPFNTKLKCGFSFLDKDDGVKSYCKMFGLLLSDSMPVKIKVKPLELDKEYYNIINDENYNVYNVDGVLNITYENEKFKSYKHLGYYIHSYTRTLIIEQILKMDINKIFGVKLDSIVYKKDCKFEYNENVFDIKKGKIESLFKGFKNNKNKKLMNALDFGTSYYKDDIDDEDDDIRCSCYYNNYFDESEFLKAPLSFLNNDNKYYYIENRIIFLGGKGGSGKTYSLLKNGLNRSNTCYTSSCWNLIQGMKEKYEGILGYSIPNLTGKCNGKAVEKIYNPNIKYIVVDEMTLINDNDIKDIIKNYPNAFIFLVGDIEKCGFFYQCSLPTIQVYNPSKNKVQYIEYTKSYRFNNELNNKLDGLRKFMKKVKDSPFKMFSLKKWIQKAFSKCYIKKEDVIYNKKDVGISARDDYKKDNELTNYFINKGTEPKYFIKTTNRKTNQLRGAEIENKPDHKNYEMKLFKTIHSFQGLDLDVDNKIIINIDKNFDYNLYYTALSRARREDQINLIE